MGMDNPKCNVCGTKMKGNGKTKAGTKRWRCSKCGVSSVRKHDNKAKLLKSFLKWLFSKDTTSELKASRSTFWRKTSWVWHIWPIAPFTGEIHDVVFLDGIWLRRKAVILIAVANGHVIGWHLARSENTQAWAALMMRTPAPKMAVSDGAPGFAKAASIVWPTTKIQRCLFHVSNQVKRCTTLRPKLEAGIELLEIANQLLEVKDASLAAQWLVDYNAWCLKWNSFLKEYTYKEGRKIYTHERLRKARGVLNKLTKNKALFTFIEMQQEYDGSWPSTNNTVESANARIREMLRNHRGMPLLHRIKAVFWWCLMHTENPPTTAEILRIMPTDDEVDGLFINAAIASKKGNAEPVEYGDGIVWEEFHMPTKYRH